jgi:hypothetical protein
MRNPDGKQVSPISFLESARQYESFAGMETKQMGLPGRTGFAQGWHQMVQKASDMIAGGGRQDYREFGQETEEDDGTTVVEQIAAPDDVPMERKTAKQMAKPLDEETTP